MGVTQFYLHLPSNSSLDKFPQNTLTEYRVSLPQTITLEGEWEVALTEIHYPHSWSNVQASFLNRFLLRNREQSGVWEAIIIPPGHYSSIDDLITTINEAVSKKDRFKDDVKFSYDSLSRKVILTYKTTWKLLWKILETYLASNLHPNLFQRLAQVKEKHTWNMASMTFTFIVTSHKHNTLEMRLYHCCALFR